MARLIILFSWLFLSPWALANDFGIAMWGDTREQILGDEDRTNLTPIGRDQYLVYKTEVIGIPEVRLVYYFQQNLLSRGAFIFRYRHPNPADHIKDFDQINNIVSKKYGEPVRSGEIWRDPSKAEGIYDPIVQMTQDNLMYQAVWQTDRMVIEHQLGVTGGKIHHQMVYRPSKAVSSDLFGMPMADDQVF